MIIIKNVFNEVYTMKNIKILSMLSISILMLFSCKDAVIDENNSTENLPQTTSREVVFKGPDQEYLKAAASVGITGQNWESPEFISSTMPNVYKISHSYTLPKGDYVFELKKATKQLNLSEVMVQEFDGPINAKDFLANRMQNHNAVILQDGKIVHEHYGNGLNEFSSHLDMSVSKSFTSMAAAIAVGQGKLDMNEKVISYLPELKGTAFEDATVQEVSDMRTAVVLAPGTTEKYWDTRLSDAQGYYGQGASEPYPNGTRDFFKLITERQDYEMGEKYDYQDVNSEVLGAVVDAVMGKPFPQVLAEDLLQKVGCCRGCPFYV